LLPGSIAQPLGYRPCCPYHYLGELVQQAGLAQRCSESVDQGMGHAANAIVISPVADAYLESGIEPEQAIRIDSS
jgi:hypothetical protein